MDVPRFPDAEYEEAFRDFLLRKYKGQRFDVIVAMAPRVMEFLVSNRGDLFREAPIVFFQTSAAFARPANSTGVMSVPDFSGTIHLARTLQPELQHVFVVIGAGAERESTANEGMVRAQLASLDSQLTVSYLSGLGNRDLEARVATLPAHSMVLYVSVNRDATGQYFNPLNYTSRIAEIANAPTYSWVDSTMGRGIVGGSLKDQEAETSALAGLAVRVLRGEPADSLPVSFANLNVPEVDWRQLRRWEIGEARIPAGTLIRFREPTAWDRYRNYIVGAALLLLTQSALIALLLVQSVRRRQAETLVLRGQAKLRASYERIRDLGGRLLMAQEAERTRIARELHDDVGQQLALLAIDLEIIRGTEPEFEAETGALLHETLNRARQVAKSVHDLSHRLHPEKLHLLGLVPALSAIQREFSRPNLNLTFEHQNVPAELPHDVILCLFRITQEALQNIVKHSAAREVSIDLIGTECDLLLTIVDDGMGFEDETARNKGLGLISMGERLDAIGGSLTIRTRPGAGTRLEVSVPHERLVLSRA
jgi:signal transduction histidine kinase